MQPTLGRATLSDWHSIVFDMARIIATLAVFIQHSTGDPALAEHKISLLGRAVIPVFLLISGYMSAMTIDRNSRFFHQVLRRYLKYYFIVVPALAITFLANVFLIHAQSPIIFHSKFETDHGLWVVLREIFQALTYSGEYWSFSTVGQGLFGNVAFWTMDYIMAYVVVTLAVFLLSGFQRVCVIIVAFAIAGPTVFLLSPLWFAGVWAYQIHTSPPKWARWMQVPSVATTVIILGGLVLVAIEILGLGLSVYEASKSVIPIEIRTHLGMAKRFTWQWMDAAILFAMVLASKYAFTHGDAPILKGTLRKLADYTLPVYMLHYVFIYVAHAMLPDYRVGWFFPDLYIMMAIAFTMTLVLSWIAKTYLRPTANHWIDIVLNWRSNP